MEVKEKALSLQIHKRLGGFQDIKQISKAMEELKENIINAIKAGNHHVSSIVEFCKAELNYSEFCKALAAVQIEHKVKYTDRKEGYTLI